MSSTAYNFTTTIKVHNLKNQPLDSVSVIVNDPARINQSGFFTGGWDGILRSYMIRPRASQEIQLKYAKQLNNPIITACVNNNSVVFAGLANGDIIAVDTLNDYVLKIGQHEAPICKLFYVQNFNIIISFGFDQLLRVWNIATDNGNYFAGEFVLPSKTHCAAYDFPYIMVGTVDGKGYFLDLSFLPDNLPIPELNKLFDLIEAGSKIQTMKIITRKQLYVLGCVDGRVALGQFIKDYSEIKLHADSSKKMLSKSMKRQTGYTNHSPVYGQVNQVDLGLINDDHFLIVVGTEQSSFFNINKRDKSRRIKQKCTAGHLSLNGKYFFYATGNDWNQGIYDLKNAKKPEVLAVRFTNSQMQSFVKKG